MFGHLGGEDVVAADVALLEDLFLFGQGKDLLLGLAAGERVELLGF